ncbi:hypothetical protein MTR67_047494 [Solanum verrucosum]|uniref:Uncharacterized protein n=1 Tax=Solanum verrucosum TaxID=315347 RepID=A0AAF0ZZ31_SOLVR|nr:hypothetical protein MTR67_047494 [Solanum verrucosum]
MVMKRVIHFAVCMQDFKLLKSCTIRLGYTVSNCDSSALSCKCSGQRVIVQDRSNDQDQFVENVVTIQVGLSGLSRLLVLRNKKDKMVVLAVLLDVFELST